MSALALSQEADQKKVVQFNHYHETAKVYQSTDLDSAALYTDSCIELSKTMESEYYLGKALQLKTRELFYASDIDSAMFYGNQSLDILSQFPDSVEYFLAEYNQGNIYLSKDDHIQALVQFKKTAKIIDERFEIYVTIDRDMVNLNRAYCHTSIGMVLDDLDDYQGAIQSYKKALKLTYKVESWESEILRSVILNNMGVSYVNMEDYEMAESYAIASMEQKKMLGQESAIGYSYQLLAQSAFGRTKFDLAIRYLDESDEKFLILLNQDEIERNKFIRAKCYLAKGNIKRALDILKGIEEVYINRFSKTEQAEFYDVLSAAYQKNGNLEMANDYLRITLRLRKELDVKNDRKIVGEFVDFIEQEEVTLNSKIQNLKNKQEKEKLELQIESDREKEVWIYTLFLVSIVCLVLIIMVIANAYRRNKKTTRDLSDSIQENKILFQEVHHRVKNNFQIISSLLNLQHGIEEDERGKKVLTDAQGRIQSMSLVHEMLYRRNEVKSIDFGTYAEELVSSIVKSSIEGSDVIKYHVDCQKELFDLEVAIPLGLILNEAVTNAVKYAFNDRDSGNIWIRLRRDINGPYHLVIQDDGPGIPEEFVEGKRESLGIELINILSEQLGGTATISNEAGTKVNVDFVID